MKICDSQRKLIESILYTMTFIVFMVQSKITHNITNQENEEPYHVSQSKKEAEEEGSDIYHLSPFLLGLAIAAHPTVF